MTMDPELHELLGQTIGYEPRTGERDQWGNEQFGPSEPVKVYVSDYEQRAPDSSDVEGRGLTVWIATIITEPRVPQFKLKDRLTIDGQRLTITNVHVHYDETAIPYHVTLEATSGAER
jgi:hypothetical protein